MAVVEASESKELQELIGFEYYDEYTPLYMSETWTDELLVENNALFAKRGLADIMEYVVVGGRNAIKFKGPEAAKYLAMHEDSNRRVAEFHQSELYKNMQAVAAAEDTKLAAGLYTAEELEQIKAPARWLAEQPRMCDLFTAEELKEYPTWTRLRIDNPQWEADRDNLHKLYEEGARRTSVWREDRKAKALQLGE
jgi:hypothetical protein